MAGRSSAPPPRGGLTLIEHMLESDAPFARIEGAIERSDLTPDEKAALWVVAWSSIDRETSRHPELERRLAPAG
jgi:hypothetical protein